MDPLDERMGGERVGLARRRAAAADVDRHRDGCIGNDDGNARSRVGVVGVADTQARDIGEAVGAVAFIGHCATVPQERIDGQPVP